MRLVIVLLRNIVIVLLVVGFFALGFSVPSDSSQSKQASVKQLDLDRDLPLRRSEKELAAFEIEGVDFSLLRGIRFYCDDEAFQNRGRDCASILRHSGVGRIVVLIEEP